MNAEEAQKRLRKLTGNYVRVKKEGGAYQTGPQCYQVAMFTSDHGDTLGEVRVYGEGALGAFVHGAEFIKL